MAFLLGSFRGGSPSAHRIADDSKPPILMSSNQAVRAELQAWISRPPSGSVVCPPLRVRAGADHRPQHKRRPASAATARIGCSHTPVRRPVSARIERTAPDRTNTPQARPSSAAPGTGGTQNAPNRRHRPTSAILTQLVTSGQTPAAVRVRPASAGTVRVAKRPSSARASKQRRPGSARPSSGGHRLSSCNDRGLLAGLAPSDGLGGHHAAPTSGSLGARCSTFGDLEKRLAAERRRLVREDSGDSHERAAAAAVAYFEAATAERPAADSPGLRPSDPVVKYLDEIEKAIVSPVCSDHPLERAWARQVDLRLGLLSTLKERGLKPTAFDWVQPATVHEFWQGAGPIAPGLVDRFRHELLSETATGGARLGSTGASSSQSQSQLLCDPPAVGPAHLPAPGHRRVPPAVLIPAHPAAACDSSVAKRPERLILRALLGAAMGTVTAVAVPPAVPPTVPPAADRPAEVQHGQESERVEVAGRDGTEGADKSTNPQAPPPPPPPISPEMSSPGSPADFVPLTGPRRLFEPASPLPRRKLPQAGGGSSRKELWNGADVRDVLLKRQDLRNSLRRPLTTTVATALTPPAFAASTSAGRTVVAALDGRPRDPMAEPVNERARQQAMKELETELELLSEQRRWMEGHISSGSRLGSMIAEAEAAVASASKLMQSPDRSREATSVAGHALLEAARKLKTEAHARQQMTTGQVLVSGA